MKALIFAAGKGTRLKPFTDNHPKALALVNNVTLLERNIKYLQSYGITNFVINIHHFGEQITDFLNRNNQFNSNIEISDEKENLLETGGGLLFAKPFLENEKTFLIMNCDILTNMNIHKFVEYHQRNSAEITLAVSDRISSRKLLFDSEMRMCGWKNTQTNQIKPINLENSYAEFAFSGIHCVNSTFFNKIKRTGSFSIIDEYIDLVSEVCIKGYKHQSKLIDVGKPEAILEAEQYF